MKHGILARLWRFSRLVLLVALGRQHRIQLARPAGATGASLLRLGSEYGGWTLMDDPALRGATVISAGLGEDASFDIELAARYGARVLIVDPTPRALTHLEAIHAAIAAGRTVRHRDYVPGGAQPLDAYALEAVRAEQLVAVPAALWRETGRMTFHPPADPRHVSHSLVPAMADGAAGLEVETRRLSEVAAAGGADPASLALVKLDIEGAELEVIADMLAAGIRPAQLLVEFDVLLRRTRETVVQVDDIHKRLLAAGYRLAHREGPRNFLYVREAATGLSS